VHLSREADRVGQHFVDVCIADRQKRLFAALSLRCALEDVSNLPPHSADLGADLQTTLN